jgi:hypothetical protein
MFKKCVRQLNTQLHFLSNIRFSILNRMITRKFVTVQNESSQNLNLNYNSCLQELNETKISFFSKISICKNCYVLRFMFPTSDHSTNLKICQYVYLSANINNQIISKPYHPISLDTDKGFIDIMIKVYPKETADPSYGVFSNYLFNLEVYRINPGRSSD